MRYELTILAYEMNDPPLSVLHGAPLRARDVSIWFSALSREPA
jgi:hypothetical protein